MRLAPRTTKAAQAKARRQIVFYLMTQLRPRSGGGIQILGPSARLLGGGAAAGGTAGGRGDAIVDAPPVAGCECGGHRLFFIRPFRRSQRLP